MLVLSVYSIRELFIKQLDHEHTAIHEYMSILETELTSERSFVQNFTLSNADLNLFSIADYSDAKRVIPLYNIKQIIDSHNTNHNILMVYDSQANNAYYKGTLSFFSSQNLDSPPELMRSIIRDEQSDTGSLENGRTFLFDNKVFFYNAYKKNRLTVYTVFSLNNYLSDHPLPVDTSSSRMIVFNKENILMNKSTLSDLSISSEDVIDAEPERSFITGSNILTCYRTPSTASLGICFVTPIFSLIRPFIPRIGVNLLLLFIVAFILFVAYKIICQVLIFPLREITSFTRQLDTDASEPPSKTTTIEEYAAIQESLHALVQKSKVLEVERQYHEKEKDHALLQYYQLQTRSHFFINCLKSLYGMLQIQKYAEMKAMLISFANHLRYIFHDNLTVVPLSAELQEVQDYYQINLMDTDRILLLDIHAPEELKDCLVPPLVIQSFLENTIKYNAKKGSPLVFTIKISQIYDEETEYLQLHLSDNGVGYSSDVLKTINRPLENTFDTYNVGINNLRRRINILFNENTHLAIFNLPTGGACEILSIPIIRDIEELKKYESVNR